jgi:hypothetical protein
LLVIPEGNLLLLLFLPLPVLLACHSRRESAVVFLLVIPAGNLLLPRPPRHASEIRIFNGIIYVTIV